MIAGNDDVEAEMKLFKRRLSFSADKKRVPRTDDPFEHEVVLTDFNQNTINEMIIEKSYIYWVNNIECLCLFQEYCIVFNIFKQEGKQI